MYTRRAKIKDVANLAQTSVATVSRVLSNSNYSVSEELRQKVEAAAVELSFVHNSTTQQSTNAICTIGLIVPTLSNLYYTQTIEGIGSVCVEKGYGVLLCNSQWSPEEEEKLLLDLHSRNVGGIIISSIKENSRPLSDLIAKGTHILQLDQRVDVQGCDNIYFDYKLGAKMAVNHLYEKGHRRIAFASTQLTRWTRQQAYQGYCEELERLSLPIDNNLVFISQEAEAENQELTVGHQLAQRFADAKCDATAVFCLNDMVAFGIIHGFTELNIVVPEDVSVIGFDDTPLASVFNPPLTTIRCPSYETGRLSAMMLIDKIQNVRINSNALNMNLQPTLVERKSVKDLNITE